MDKVQKSSDSDYASEFRNIIVTKFDYDCDSFFGFVCSGS
jgi:hypothetical protein